MNLKNGKFYNPTVGSLNYEEVIEEILDYMNSASEDLMMLLWGAIRLLKIGLIFLLP